MEPRDFDLPTMTALGQLLKQCPNLWEVVGQLTNCTGAEVGRHLEKLLLRHEQPPPLPLVFDGTATIEQVCRLLNAATAHLDSDGGFSVSCVFTDRNQAFSEACRGHKFLACYAVTGGSEGHYVHVEAISGYDEKGKLFGRPLFLAKTFGGPEKADQLAAAARHLLGA